MAHLHFPSSQQLNGEKGDTGFSMFHEIIDIKKEFQDFHSVKPKLALFNDPIVKYS